jgi:hypothetical protein
VHPQKLEMRQLQIIFLLLLVVSCQVSAQDDTLQYITNLAGGGEQLEALWKEVSDHASILRNGMKNVMDGDHSGFTALVKRVTFEDGVKWAAKISEYARHGYIQQGLSSLQAIERYCPTILAPRTHGTAQTLANSTFIYHFMDWIDGLPLDKDLQYKVFEYEDSGTLRRNITISNQVITQLAEFVYNLTACRIPQTQSTFLCAIIQF